MRCSALAENGARYPESDEGVVSGACRRGFRTRSGQPPQRICRNGEWTRELGECLQVRCRPDMTPTGNAVFNNAGVALESITGICRAGHAAQSEGLPTRTCVRSGDSWAWSDVSRPCEPVTRTCRAFWTAAGLVAVLVVLCGAVWLTVWMWRLRRA